MNDIESYNRLMKELAEAGKREEERRRLEYYAEEYAASMTKNETYRKYLIDAFIAGANYK